MVAFLWNFYPVWNVIIQAYINFANSAIFIVIYFDCCELIGYARLYRNNFPDIKQKKTFWEFFFGKDYCVIVPKTTYLSSSQQVESLKKVVLCSLYTYCTSSMLGLHHIVFALLVSTLIAITFSINKKWKTDNKQFASDILMLCNAEVSNVPYSCFLSLFHDEYFWGRTKEIQTHENYPYEIVFFWLSSLWLTASFFLFW